MSSTSSTPGPHPGPHPGTPSGSSHGLPRGPVLTRVSETLRELRELTEERAERLEAIEAVLTATITDAERIYSNVTANARQDLDDTKETLAREEQQHLADIAAQYDDVLKKLHRERAGLLSETKEKAASKLDRIKKEHEEATWLLTTVHDSDATQAGTLAKSRIETLDKLQRGAEEAAAARRDLHEDFGIPSPDAEAVSSSGVDSDPAVERHIEQIEADLTTAQTSLERIASSPFPKLARGARYWISAIVLVGLGVAGGFAAGGFTVGAELYIGLAGGAVLAVGLLLLCRVVGDKLVRKHSEICAGAIGSATARIASTRDLVQHDLGERMREIDAELESERSAAQAKLIERRERLDSEITSKQAQIDERFTPKIDRYEFERDAKIAGAAERRASIASQAQERFDTLTQSSRETRDSAVAYAKETAARERTALDDRWEEAEPRLAEEAERLHTMGLRHAPKWDSTGANQDATPPPMARIGWAKWRVPEVAAGTPVRWRGPREIELPIPVEFPRVGSVFIEAPNNQRSHAIELMRTTMLRILTTIPPGKARFTIIDPVGLGESFAAFMHLADHQDQLVSGRIWTEPRHIEQRLLDLTEHMESVIQKYLRNDFPTIEAYNRAAGEIAEPYRYLVIADFPTNISDAAGKRIASIASSGARCGVHTIIAHDLAKESPKGVSLDELRSNSLTIGLAPDSSPALPQHDALRHADIQLDTMPADVRTKALLREVGSLSIDAGRVQVPFAAVGPGEGEAWTSSAAHVLRIPIGRSGASKIQELVLGEGTAQHALIAGRTGSGKSTLFHVMVTSCAAWYSTDEVELYLVDFKKGVEFKPYATHALPHARVIAIETDRAFGLSVLQRIDQELTERGERMRRAEVQNIASFREKTGERMPRVLLIVDEFQELFVEDDQIAQQATVLLDRIVRQGRAFGVHVVLGSQTLGGAYAINRATMSQMNVRIALQCDEQDSYLILGEDNSAARLLERPGEAVYNAQGGKVEANSPFQVVWLPDTVRDDALALIAERARQSESDTPEPIVFEGNAPADPYRTPELAIAIAEPRKHDAPIPIHLGVPVAIAQPVRAHLERSRSENALVLSTNAESAQAMLATSLLGFERVNGATPGSVAYVVHTAKGEQRHALGAFASGLNIDTRVSEIADIGDALLEIDAEIERRTLIGTSGEPPALFVLAGLHLCRDIRKPDDLGFSSFSDDNEAPKSPGQLLDRIIQDGPSVGVHTLLWADTLNAFERSLERRRMSDFSHRVLTQMNAMDSAAILDSPAASRLAQGRALYYNDRTTASIAFRPYAFPDGR